MSKKNKKPTGPVAVSAAGPVAVPAPQVLTPLDALNAIFQYAEQYKPATAIQVPAGVLSDMVKILAAHETKLSALATVAPEKK